MKVLLLNPPGRRIYIRDYLCSKTTKSNYLFHPIDLLVLEFSLETRNRPGTSLPRYDDNLVTYVVRRFANADEDEKPNYYLPTEITPEGDLTPPAAWRSDDLFGPVAYLPSGELVARPASEGSAGEAEGGS